MKPESRFGLHPAEWSRAGLEQLRKRPAWQVAVSQLGVNSRHLHLDRGLGCTGRAAGRALGAETRLPSSSAPVLQQLPAEGSKRGTRSLCCPQQAGAVGAGSGLPQQQGHLLAAPKVSPAAGLSKGWDVLDGRVGSNRDGLCVIISQAGFTGSPRLLSSGREHPLLRKAQLVNVP